MATAGLYDTPKLQSPESVVLSTSNHQENGSDVNTIDQFDEKSLILTLSSTDSDLEVPLNTSWSFWIDKSTRGFSAAEYQANLKKVYTVSTVQAFWGVFNHIPAVDKVSDKYSYHLMRYEHRPLWEDEYNSKGGTWRLKITQEHTPKVWKELLLAAIGEQFSANIHPDDDICGISVSVRERDNIIQIWNKDSELAEETTVLQKVHELIPDLSTLAEFYKPHQTHRAFEGQKKSSE
ncbi:Eukaryotic translation initiation factor 4E type 3 [Nymphon striatum]|nr:Eukaryotic translation initiation factor 4E type 3 [Nymphon striatum]